MEVMGSLISKLPPLLFPRWYDFPLMRFRPQDKVLMWFEPLVWVWFECVPKGSCLRNFVPRIVVLKDGGLLRRGAQWEVLRSLSKLPLEGIEAGTKVTHLRAPESKLL